MPRASCRRRSARPCRPPRSTRSRRTSRRTRARARAQHRPPRQHMTDIAAPLPAHHHAPPAHPTGIHRFTAPGWWRALWTTPLVGFAGLGLTCLIRWGAHWDPIWYSVPLVTVATVTFPIGLLIGIGAFDYWAYYASGRPTREEDHAGHGARRWQDYFRPNT